MKKVRRGKKAQEGSGSSWKIGKKAFRWPR